MTTNPTPEAIAALLEGVKRFKLVRDHEYGSQMLARQNGNYVSVKDYTALRDALTAAQAKAEQLQYIATENQKRAEKAEARISELEADLKSTLDRETETHFRHDAKMAKAEARVVELEGAGKDAIVAMQEARSVIVSKREHQVLTDAITGIRAALEKKP